MSRTALDGYPLGDVEKDELLAIIKRFTAIYFTEVLGFCIMGNHFHLLVRMLPDEQFDDAAVERRFKLLYGKDARILPGQVATYRRKWAGLSELMRDVKQTFSRFYNKRHRRRGFFLGGAVQVCDCRGWADTCELSGVYRPQPHSRGHRGQAG